MKKLPDNQIIIYNTEGGETKIVRKSAGKDLSNTTFFLKNNAGFTLIELLITIAIASAVATMTLPVGMRFYQMQTLDEAAIDMLSALRRAYAHAVFQKNDSAFGVKFLSGSYTLFQGSSYAARTVSEDENVNLSSGLTTSGIDEIVFSKLAGTTSDAVLTVSLGSDNRNIAVNTKGKAERQ